MLAFLLGVSLGSFVTKPLDYGFEYEQAKEVSTQTIYHSGFSSWDNRQAIIQYAYKKWWIDFITMIECENGNRDAKAVSRTRDYWICQLHYSYNKEFIDSDRFNDVYSQIDYCYEKWKINPNLWYWPKRKIKGQLCKDYVKSRFIFQ